MIKFNKKKIFNGGIAPPQFPDSLRHRCELLVGGGRISRWHREPHDDELDLALPWIDDGSAKLTSSSISWRPGLWWKWFCVLNLDAKFLIFLFKF